MAQENRIKYCKVPFYEEEASALSEALGCENISGREVAIAILNQNNIIPKKVTLSEGEKVGRKLSKIAEHFGVSEADLQKAKELLRLN